eukprot:TRINITY_DN67373_c0_g1_i1.p1 TRINITY_DN67373_c0_g1~~TRINITY_DN67373_c0_g1_i1.p1  ORF type:complete len:320 (-),score=40.59 TRINITY_DN67373_c0_g1_i1:88-1047(-)
MRQASFPEVGARAVRGDASVDLVEAHSREKRRSANTVRSVVSKHAVHATSVMLFLVYLVPFQLSLQLGLDQDVNFWMGSAMFCVAVALPISLFVIHLVHVQLAMRGLRRQEFLIVSVFILSTCLCVLSGVSSGWARTLEQQLMSQDCTKSNGVVDKLLLQEAYVDALKTYDACVSRLFKENGQKPLMRRPLLHMCQEYHGNGQNLSIAMKITNATSNMQRLFAKREARVHSDRLSNYLAGVEQNHACGGFCHRGPRLWSPPGLKDEACSRFVALKFKTVRGLLDRLLCTSFIGGLIALVGVKVISKAAGGEPSESMIRV